MDEFIGMIKLFAGLQAPKGWMFCQGQLLQVNSNQALYSILGTTYGGDGRTTFGLPNLSGAVPLCSGVSPTLGAFTPGQKGGSENIPLTAASLPAHSHAMSGSVSMDTNLDGAETPEPNGAFPSIAEKNVYALSATGTGNMAPVTGNLTISGAGGNTPADKRMPFVAINYIICIYGLYPPRN